MISQKSNPLITEIKLAESLDLNKFDKYVCDEHTAQHFPGIIMQYIFPSSSAVMPVDHAEDIVVWLSDQKYSKSVHKLAEYWREQEKNIHIIQSTEGKSGYRGDVKVYYLKEGTEGALALGYLNYFLNEKKLVPESVSLNEPSYIAFSESLKQYDTTFVKHETGLSDNEIRELYRVMEESGQAYHWLAFSAEYDEFSAESVRAVCLIAALHLQEDEITRIPVSYEQDPEKKAFAAFPEPDNVSYTLVSEQELTLTGRCSSTEVTGNSKKITFYNWEFADRFDMDPFPSYTPKVMKVKNS